jgi:hypothetical protein
MTAPTAEAIAKAVETVKGEVAEDVTAGIIPEGVETFSHLHDWVDANMYGGDDADALWDDALDHAEAARQGIDPYRALNAMQEAVDQWIRSGGLREVASNPRCERCRFPLVKRRGYWQDKNGDTSCPGPDGTIYHGHLIGAPS